MRDPKVACLLLQAEVATVIPDGFLSTGSLTRLDLSSVSFVTQIGDKFLEGCDSLTSVNLSGLSNVTRIGSYFLAGCKSLTTLDLTPLNKSQVIGEGFLSGCKALTNLDLTPLNNVTKIESFLRHCEGLTTLDLTPLSNVTRIGSYFLAGCKALTTLGDTHNVHKKKEYKQCFRTWCRSHVQPPRGVSRATIRHTDRPSGRHTRRRLCAAGRGTAIAVTR